MRVGSRELLNRRADGRSQGRRARKCHLLYDAFRPDCIKQQTPAGGIILIDKVDVNKLIEEWGTLVTLDQDRDNPALLPQRIAGKGRIEFRERKILSHVVR